MYTTLNKLHAAGAPEYCKRGWTAVCNHVGDDYYRKIRINTLIDVLGWLGALWAAKTFDNYKENEKELERYMESPHTDEEIKLKLIEVFGG